MKEKYFSKSFDRYVFDKHTESNKYKDRVKEERKHRKRHRSRSNSSYECGSDTERRKHSVPRREEERSVKAKHKKKLHSSYNEESYGNHYKKRGSTEESYKKCRRDLSKTKRKSRDDYNNHESKKSKNESNISIKVKIESDDEEEEKHGQIQPKQEKKDRSEPSGSRSSLKSRDSRSREDEIHEWGDAPGKSKSTKQVKEVQKPDFKLSGKLAEDTNIFNGVVIKYSEPPEARMPKKRWRLYPFKGDQGLPTLYIHRQSAYLLGRDRKVVDIPIDHPSCSKQHAALQYRLVSYKRPNGTLGKQIRLYIIDLESANGTFINNNKIEAKKYVELFEKDVIKFGFSSREYVLLHEHSKDSENSEDDS